MPTPKQMQYEKAAQTVMKALARRRFTAEYCPTAKSAREAILAQIAPDATVGWGGTLTMAQLGVLDALRERKQPCFDRERSDETPEEVMHRCLNADVFLMSANALTEDGCLVNLDGNGNRVAALIYGPKKVVVAVGMNKLCPNVEAAIERTRHIAAPMNAQRFPGESPCRITGVCADCTSPGCICSNLVITRLCHRPGRIHIVLIGEDLGM